MEAAIGETFFANSAYHIGGVGSMLPRGGVKVREAQWTFLSNHGRVLALIAKHPRSTTREIAAKIGITERSVQNIVTRLEAEGYIARHKEGRRNRYVVHPELPMRHSLERDHPVGDLLTALGCALPSASSPHSSSLLNIRGKP